MAVWKTQQNWKNTGISEIRLLLADGVGVAIPGGEYGLIATPARTATYFGEEHVETKRTEFVLVIQALLAHRISGTEEQ